MSKEVAQVEVVVAHHNCPRASSVAATMGRARPVMTFFANDPAKELNYFRCQLCGTEVAVRVKVQDYGNVADATQT